MTDLELGRIEFGDRHGRAGSGGAMTPITVTVPTKEMDSLQKALVSVLELLQTLELRVAALEKRAKKKKVPE